MTRSRTAQKAQKEEMGDLATLGAYGYDWFWLDLPPRSAQEWENAVLPCLLYISLPQLRTVPRSCVTVWGFL